MAFASPKPTPDISRAVFFAEESTAGGGRGSGRAETTAKGEALDHSEGGVDEEEALDHRDRGVGLYAGG